MNRFNKVVEEAGEGLEDVDPDARQEALKNLYDGVSISDLNTSLVITARTLIEKEPNYTFATARLLLDSIRREGLRHLGLAEEATHEQMREIYPKVLPSYLKGLKQV